MLQAVAGWWQINTLQLSESCATGQIDRQETENCTTTLATATTATISTAIARLRTGYCSSIRLRSTTLVQTEISQQSSDGLP